MDGFRNLPREADWDRTEMLAQQLSEYRQREDCDGRFADIVGNGLTYPVDEQGWVDWDRYPPPGHTYSHRRG